MWQKLAGFCVLALLPAWACQGSPAPASADRTGADFFAGRTLTYIVSYGTGGGYDTYARLIAKHLPSQLPGVRVVVRNVVGASGIVGGAGTLLSAIGLVKCLVLARSSPRVVSGESSRQRVVMFLWFGTAIVSVLVAGVVIGGALFVLVFLRRRARES